MQLRVKHEANKIDAAQAVQWPGGGPADLPRTIGFWGASAVMVGVIIGSGIFRTPTTIAGLCGDPWVILMFWLAGGVLALFGAFTFAELASMHPQSGGVYVFLREAFGRGTAFVFGWTYMLITKPLAAAGIAVVLAENVNTLLGTALDERVLTCGVVVVLTGVNARGTVLGAGVAGVLTALKIGALVAIVVLAAAMSRGDPDGFAAAPVERSVWSAAVAIMAAVLWTYDGWSDVGAIAGEVRDPKRNLWRVYAMGTLLVTGLYLAVNAVYLWMVPLEQMRVEKSVAPVVMERLIGPAAGSVVAVIIIVSTLGSTHSSIITGARVTFQQARDGLLFQFLGQVHSRYRTPAVALWTQCGLSCAAALYARTFERLAGGFVFTMWIFYGLAGAAIFVLRFRQAGVERPFRCPGYPVVPGLFVLSAVVMTVVSVIEDPWGTAVGLLVRGAGAPAYVIWRWVTSGHGGS